MLHDPIKKLGTPGVHNEDVLVLEYDGGPIALVRASSPGQVRIQDVLDGLRVTVPQANERYEEQMRCHFKVTLDMLFYVDTYRIWPVIVTNGTVLVFAPGDFLMKRDEAESMVAEPLVQAWLGVEHGPFSEAAATELV